MAKRVIWSQKAKLDRREILEYWKRRNGNKIYSRKLADRFREKINHIKRFNYIGTPTDMTNVRMTVCENYSIFYEVEEEMIVILVIWDNRRNPEDFSLE